MATQATVSRITSNGAQIFNPCHSRLWSHTIDTAFHA